MSDIEWTDETWNPVTGWCAHCYAETFAERFRGVPGHPFEQGFDLKLWPERLTKPFTWKKPRKVFVNSMSDLFHEDVPFEFIDRVFAVMALTPQHTYQVLTKRPERMREYVQTRATRPEARVGIILSAMAMGASQPGDVEWPLPNVWLGTSVENQHWADIRIPELLATPAAVRFLSCEPLLGPLDLRNGLHDSICADLMFASDMDGAPRVCICSEPREDQIEWVIAGGESGPKARPFDLAWARSIVSQCRAAGVPVFVKQLGAVAYDDGPMCGWPVALDWNHPIGSTYRLKLKSRKGGDMAEWPEDLRVREWPRGAM